MNELHDRVADLLLYIGIDKTDTSWVSRVALVLAAVIISYTCTTLFKYIIIPSVRRITSRTKATWDDYLFNEDLMRNVRRLIPPIILYLLLPFAFEGMPILLIILHKGCLIYLIVNTILLIRTFLNSLYDISNEHETLRDRPLKGIYQMIKLIVFGIGAILIISILIDQNAGRILAGLGASAAVLMLIFKDSILGLVAGVQLSANDMLRPGDWITMNKYGANGYVLEVSLTTVKVQNFDKTITTIPPYALVSDSFQNWRGMRESGGRRIMRSVSIDMNSVHFCTPEEIKMFLSKGWISQEEANGTEQLVNLQIFRNYMLQYLRTNPKINDQMMTMVRQLQPSAEGVPLELYCFTRSCEWIEYEQAQGEVMDHFFAVIPQFGLRVYQRPTGADLNTLRAEV